MQCLVSEICALIQHKDVCALCHDCNEQDRWWIVKHLNMWCMWCTSYFCELHPLRWLIMDVNSALVGWTLHEFWNKDAAQASASSHLFQLSSSLLPNHDEPPTTAETQRNLMWLSTTYSSAQKCQYPLPCCVYYMCLRGEEIQKVSNCDYSLVWFWTQALRLGDSLTETETWKSLRKLE